jgi:photosystem II stability/assembly factor-like uncharacterized protein
VSNAHNAQIAHLIISTIIILLVPLLSFIAVIPAQRASASPEAVKWSKVNIPTVGEAGSWVLAHGSDIQHLTLAGDGSLYAYGKGLPYTLYKSTDGGLSWAYIGKVQDAITGIAVSPHDAGTIYYATSSSIYRSTNGGKTFVKIPESPGEAGTGHREITSIAAAWLDHNIIAVGIKDADSSEFGGVYTLNEADIISEWVDTHVGSYDVYAVAFSPNYPLDRQLVAVMTDETDTFIASKISDGDWGASIGSARLNAVVVADSAAIAFPDDFDADVSSGKSVFFTGIDTGTGEGDVYKISCAEAPATSISTDLNVGSIYGQSNTDITGLTAYSNNSSVILLAGAADSARTYISTDGGINWTKSRKEPTGDSDTCVLIPPDFAATGRMYAATSGNDNALSISRDIGESWNQLSLIDTSIDTIVDLEPSPGYSQDDTLFMITFGGSHNLWRSIDDGSTWERILSDNLASVDSLKFVALPPQYGDDCHTVFVAGESNGSPVIWESKDNGQTYRRRFIRDPTTGTAFPVDAWAIADENTLLIGSYDGSHGIVYRSTDDVFSYSEGVLVGSQPLHSLALSPDYENDGNTLIGNTDGWVLWSSDNGTSFQALPKDAASPPLSGFITVAFDPEFKTNHTVYAASDTVDSGLHRFVTGRSTDWESIDDTLPAGATINRLAAAGNGTVYAANSDADGGMERCLNPTFASGPTFETVTRGLSDGATLSGLWQCDNRLWSIDTTSCKLMTFLDTLTSPATQVSPDNGASGIGSLIDHTIRDIRLNWETMDGATSYKWQCDYDTDFSSVPSGFEDSTSSSSARLPTLEPATTYYWHVRASAPVLGPWSPKRSFTTSLDTEAVALKPEIPAAGATGVSIRPVFQWTAVFGASAYELLVSADDNFENPSIVRINDYALPTNAWQCDVRLDYDTTYYWKVRATTASTHSGWSSAGVFTTEPPPAADNETSTAPPAPTPQNNPDKMTELTQSLNSPPVPTTPALKEIKNPSPTAPTQPTILLPNLSQPPSVPAWIIYIIGGLLSIIILALIVILVIVLKTRRF